MSIGKLLFVLFVYLKVTHQIDWSWWWVFAPLLGDFVMFWVADAINEWADK